MKNIEIITSQNVVLQYELASLQDRVLAFIIDTICLVVGLMLASGIAGMMFSGSVTLRGVVMVALITVFSAYSLLFEFFNKGRSLGKMALRIQVIKLAGRHATFSDYAARWIFRLVDVYFSLGGIASLLVMSSAKGQRIGDIIANTAVVKTQPRMSIDLNDLLSIHKTSKYVPKYQQARRLQEQDALLIKATLERYRRFRNRAHLDAISLLTERVQEIMGLDSVHEEKSVFLQTVLQDYVVLSR